MSKPKMMITSEDFSKTIDRIVGKRIAKDRNKTIDNLLKENNEKVEEFEKKEILETYKWIKVKKYIDDDNLSWEDRYKKLENHHIDETTFLINKIREIIK